MCRATKGLALLTALSVASACKLKFDEIPARDASSIDASDGAAADTPDGSTFVAARFKVGTFTKSVATAPVMQTITHGLGTTPRAVLLWTSGNDIEGVEPGMQFGFGFTDELRASRSLAISSNDEIASTPQTDRRISDTALTLVGDGAVTVGDARMTAWDDATFTLTWEVSGGGSAIIHFLVIGGTDVRSRVVTWQMPDVVGPFTVDTVGFTPDLVLHAQAGAGFTASPPANEPQAGLGLAAMTAAGQWSSFMFAAGGAGGSNTQRGTHEDACIHTFDADSLEVRRASFTSMNADGFTMTFTMVGAAGTQAFSLALAGIGARVGSFDKSAGASQAVPLLGFQPAALMLASVQDLERSSAVSHGRFGLGATDGTSSAASAFVDTDALATTNVASIDRTVATFLKVDNDTMVVDAEARLASFDPDGFTLQWPINDAIATSIQYIALAPL